MNKLLFDTFALNDNKYELLYDNYLLEEEKSATSLTDTDEVKKSEEFLAHQKPHSNVSLPHICTWDYLTKNEIKSFLDFEKKSEIRRFIDSKLNKKPRGIPRMLFSELIYTVRKFCKSSNFTVEQSGAVLSQFYLTHVFFISSLDTGPEKLYDYFKNLQLCHSLPFPPASIKLFNLNEIKNIMIYFCRLYLRNLPLIRFMCLPNFTLRANYHVPHEKILGKKAKKGKKKGKKKKHKKKK